MHQVLDCPYAQTEDAAQRTKYNAHGLHTGISFMPTPKLCSAV